MRIKQRLGILAATITAAVTVTALAAAPPDTVPSGEGGVSDPPGTEVSVPEPPDIQSAAATVEKCYWVHQMDGMVAVFDADNRTEPINVTEIALHTLREGDQAMILGGVLIEGEVNLSHFLEGFGP